MHTDYITTDYITYCITLQDNRIAGGYENVPTVDIHMTQIGWDAHWLQIIKDYITQYNDAIFTGHHMEVGY